MTKLPPSTFRDSLLAWYDTHKRDLPWRRTNDPYRIWLSEVMLQQTQVERVVGYYTRFLESFPTLEALAAADADAVLKRWEGLGYYSRARALHRAAKVIITERNGEFPGNSTELRALPGFGAYTAAAVASIAFGEPVAAIDTNVRRVLARFGTIGGTDRAHHAAIADLADRVLDPDRPGDFNQAMMELGATVCRSRSPLCPVCPIQAGCAAWATGTPERWPEAKPKPKRPTVVAACGILFEKGKTLVVQRPPDGLLGGLWEFPGGRQGDEETPADACIRGFREKTGLPVTIDSAAIVVRHTFSHFHVELHAFVCRAATRKKPTGGRWVTETELNDLALTRTARAISESLFSSSCPS